MRLFNPCAVSYTHLDVYKRQFYLLGYSFGGILVQEIDKIKPAEKVVILGSIKSDKEKSRFIKIGEFTKIPKVLPERIFNEKSAVAYSLIRKLFDPKNPKILEYFTVRNPYYLKWSIEKVCLLYTSRCV